MSQFVEWFKRYGAMLLAGVALSVASVTATTVTATTVTATTVTANAVVADTVDERTAAAGVTIDGALIKDDRGIFERGTLLGWNPSIVSEAGYPLIGEAFGSLYFNTGPPSTAEFVRSTRTIVADAFNAGGNGVIIYDAWGTAAANTNSKIVRLRFGASGSGTGGTVVGGACTFASASDTTWRARWIIQRTGVDTQSTYVVCDGAATDSQAVSTGTVDENAVIDLALTITNATSAADLTLLGTMVHFAN